MAEAVNVVEGNDQIGLKSHVSSIHVPHEKSKEHKLNDKPSPDQDVKILEGIASSHAAKEQATHDRPDNMSISQELADEKSTMGTDAVKACGAESVGKKDVRISGDHVSGDEELQRKEKSRVEGKEGPPYSKVARAGSQMENKNDVGNKTSDDQQCKVHQLTTKIDEGERDKKPSKCDNSNLRGTTSRKGLISDVKSDAKKRIGEEHLPAESNQELQPENPKIEEKSKVYPGDEKKLPTCEENIRKMVERKHEETVAKVNSGKKPDNKEPQAKEPFGKKEGDLGTYPKNGKNELKKVSKSDIGGKSPTFDKVDELHSKLKTLTKKEENENYDQSVKTENQISGNHPYIKNPDKDEKDGKSINADGNESQGFSGGVMVANVQNIWNNNDKKLFNVDESSEIVDSTKEANRSTSKKTNKANEKYRKLHEDDELKGDTPLVAKKTDASNKEASFIKNHTDSGIESHASKSSDANSDNNGEVSSMKSDSSLEDSDKASESDAAFTKRASNDPNFAVVFSFLSLFGGLLNLPECSLDELEQCLDNCTDLNLQAENHGLLEKLHLKLLRRLSRSCKTQFSSLGQVSNDRLIKNLIKFSKFVDLDLALDLEKFGYHVLGSAERLLLLKALCEIHFDENPRFKIHFTDEYIKTDNFEALRLQPTGFDMQGKEIWYQQDSAAGFRIYSVEEDDGEGSSWKLLASTIEDFDRFLENLRKKSEVNPKDIALLKRNERVAKRKQTKEKVKIVNKRGKGRARATRNKKVVSESESDEEDENPCAHCYSNKRPDLVLLCDQCDAAYHTLCLRPPLMSIPEGDWICPYCQQLVLIETLQLKHKDISARRKALERVAKRAVFDDIKLSNIVENGEDDSRRSGRKRSKIDYNFTNYNQMISEAISTEPNQLQQKIEISSHSFYTQSLSRRKTRKLNDLEGDGFESDTSEYEKSLSEDEARSKATAELAARGCRRSRRLKRKYDHDEKSESSESEEDAFVRRSSRRRKPTEKTYMEYESDDTPEEVLMKKVTVREENEEYVASDSEDDPEEIYHVKTRRVIVSDEEDDDISINDDAETDLEDEELCEEMEKNLVSDDSEQELNVPLSEEDENEAADIIDGETTTDEDNYEDISDDEKSKRERKRKKNVLEGSEKKRGGKDIRTIIKSIREEEEGSAKKGSRGVEEKGKKEETKENDSKEEDKNNDSKEEETKEDDSKEEDKNNDSKEEETKEDDSKQEVSSKEVEMKEETEDMEKVVISDDRESKIKEEAYDDQELSVEDVKMCPKNAEPEEGNVAKHANTTMTMLGEAKATPMIDGEADQQIKKRDFTNDISSSEPSQEKTIKPSIESDNEVANRRTELSLPLRGAQDSGSERGAVRRNKKMGVKTEGSSSDLPILPPSTGLSHDQRVADYAQDVIALSSYNQSMRHPFTPPFYQGSSPMMSVPHQSNILRPRPYSTDVMRQMDHFQQPNTASGYPTAHNPYHMRPPYPSFMEQQQYFPQNMQSFQRVAPPAYPGYPGNEPQSIWRPQTVPPMQWNYSPYRNMSPQAEQKQRPVPLHRPYLDVQSFGESKTAPSIGAKSSKLQNRLQTTPQHSSDNSQRRPKNSPADSRKPSATESYAAFQSMVITPSTDKGLKKTKRS